jgi:hypothetical protein
MGTILNQLDSHNLFVSYTCQILLCLPCISLFLLSLTYVYVHCFVMRKYLLRIQFINHDGLVSYDLVLFKVEESVFAPQTSVPDRTLCNLQLSRQI